ASAALSAGSTVRCGAAASRCVSHAAPTISAAAASSQRFIGIPLCDGPTGTGLRTSCGGVARGVPRVAVPQRQGACGGDAILEPEPRPGLDAQARCSRAARARRNTAYHIAWVSFPVLVFCRLGWYDAITTLPSGSWLATPCPNGGRSRGASRCHHPAAL